MIGVNSFSQSKLSAKKPSEIIVAKDGTGNYKTVQEALNAVPNENNTSVIIFIKNGIYKEKLHRLYCVEQNISRLLSLQDPGNQESPLFVNMFLILMQGSILKILHSGKAFQMIPKVF